MLFFNSKLIWWPFELSTANWKVQLQPFSLCALNFHPNQSSPKSLVVTLDGLANEPTFRFETERAEQQEKKSSGENIINSIWSELELVCDNSACFAENVAQDSVWKRREGEEKQRWNLESLKRQRCRSCAHHRNLFLLHSITTFNFQLYFYKWFSLISCSNRRVIENKSEKRKKATDDSASRTWTWKRRTLQASAERWRGKEGEKKHEHTTWKNNTKPDPHSRASTEHRICFNSDKKKMYSNFLPLADLHCCSCCFNAAQREMIR